MHSVAVFFLIITYAYAEKTGNDMRPVLEKKIDNKFKEYADGVTKWLKSFNCEHLGNTELGRNLHYNDIKTKIEENTKEAGNGNTDGRSTKKMGMAMMPLIFHIGATSTWMLLTTVLAAKSLAVGLILLIFKIAVSSAKLAAFFTQLKGKHADPHHGHHEWAWTPQYHDHQSEHHPEHHGTISHIPEWTPNDIPHTISEFKNNEIHDDKPEFNYKPQEFHEYKTLPEMPMLPGFHKIDRFDEGFSNFNNDFNHFEAAKKNIDTKDTKLARSGSISKRKGFKIKV